MGDSMIWALVTDLSDPTSDPILLPATDLYRYKPERVCVAFNPPKSCVLKDRMEEFGVQSDRNGETMLVRHHIIALSGMYIHI